MTGLRRRLGVMSGEVIDRLLEGLADAESRAHLSVPGTHALIELVERHRRAGAQEAGASGGVEPGRPAESGWLRRATATGLDHTRGVARRALRLRHTLAFAIALVVVTGGATASSLWLAPAGNPIYGFAPGLISSAPPAPQLQALAVLRRPQTGGDRAPTVALALADVNNFTSGLRSDYVRVLEATRSGPVVLVPVRRRAAGNGLGPPHPAVNDALCVYYPFQGAPALDNSTHCWSTAEVLAGTAVASIGDHEYGLVPDGVTSVRIAVGSWSTSARVAENFFDVTLSRGGSGSAPVPVAPTIVFVRGPH